MFATRVFLLFFSCLPHNILQYFLKPVFSLIIKKAAVSKGFCGRNKSKMYFDTVIKTSVHLLVPWFFNNSFCFSFLLHCIFQILSQVNCCCCGINLFLSFHSQKYPCGCIWVCVNFLFGINKNSTCWMLQLFWCVSCFVDCWLLLLLLFHVAVTWF